MPKNQTYNRFHCTISPRQTTDEELKAVAASLIKGVAKYCYVIEHGSNGTHPHLHILLEYPQNKRIDTLKTSIKTKLKKNYEITPQLLKITAAYNPIYLISTYLQKEQEIINEGFDIEALKKEQRSHNKEVFRTDAQQLVITRSSLLRLYRNIKPRLTTTMQDYPDSINTHMKEVMTLLEADNYNISFLIWNKKQTLDVIKYANKIEIEFMSSFRN